MSVSQARFFDKPAQISIDAGKRQNALAHFVIYHVPSRGDSVVSTSFPSTSPYHREGNKPRSLSYVFNVRHYQIDVHLIKFLQDCAG